MGPLKKDSRWFFSQKTKKTKTQEKKEMAHPFDRKPTIQTTSSGDRFKPRGMVASGVGWGDRNETIPFQKSGQYSEGMKPPPLEIKQATG